MNIELAQALRDLTEHLPLVKNAKFALGTFTAGTRYNENLTDIINLGPVIKDFSEKEKFQWANWTLNKRAKLRTRNNKL